MEGCKEKEGMCIHEKLMAGLLGIVILAVLAVKLF
jgi:hypothetical protein